MGGSEKSAISLMLRPSVIETTQPNDFSMRQHPDKVLSKDFANDLCHSIPRNNRNSDGECMFARRAIDQSPRQRRTAARRVRRDVPRQAAPLDAAGLILHLEMAELIRQAGDSLRQHRGEDRRGWRSWWRRFLG
jgi:hypothetical protein